MHHRAWTPEGIQAWRDERDERRKGKGLKPLDAVSPEDKEAALDSEKRDVVESESSLLTSQAWDIGKHPLLQFPAPFSGFLLLPKNYHASDGTHKMRVREGDDLNMLVFKYYDEAVDPRTYPGNNYVGQDGIRAKRHEYLGPSPRLASYRLNHNEIEVEWWEEYIKDGWIGKGKWKVEVEFDEAVEAWFLIDRNGP